MTEENFNQLIHVDIPCALFHVTPKDKCDVSGGQLDETILVGIICENDWCLKYKPLQWFLDTFLMLEEPSTEEELFHQIQEDEREEWEKKIDGWEDGGCSTGLNED